MLFADTIYASQDRADDEKAGIKSSARLFGARLRTITGAFGMAFIGFLTLAAEANGNGAVFSVVCATACIHIISILWAWSIDDPKSGGRLFEVCVTRVSCISQRAAEVIYYHLESALYRRVSIRWSRH